MHAYVELDQSLCADVWMGVCIAFVFATFFEIALVHYILTQASKLDKKAKELRMATSADQEKTKVHARKLHSNFSVLLQV